MSSSSHGPIRYPKAPLVQGALPLDELIDLARKRSQIVSLDNDHNLLLAALLLNHRPSVLQALAVGALLAESNQSEGDSFSCLFIISGQYNSRVDAVGS